MTSCHPERSEGSSSKLHGTDKSPHSILARLRTVILRSCPYLSITEKFARRSFASLRMTATEIFLNLLKEKPCPPPSTS